MLTCINCEGEGRSVTYADNPERCPRCQFRLDPKIAKLNRKIEVVAREILALKQFYDAEASMENRDALRQATCAAGQKLDGLLQELAEHANGLN